jgi:hypothetical protein
MESFEQVVAEILWREGYWVRTSVKVELTKDEKHQINLPSAPRWEIDVLAYKARENAILAVECKSYLDSPGVAMKGFDGTSDKAGNRSKLFNKSNIRDVVFSRLRPRRAESCGANGFSPSSVSRPA